jgi:protein arginine kinase activator
MAEGPNCYFCGKKATVHFTQIINNKILKMDLCESCAKQHGIGDPPSFSLTELLSKTSLFAEDSTAEVTCPHCGFSPSSPQFKKMGRLGCPYCYEQFHTMLGTILKDLHPRQIHQGKSPKNLVGRQATREKIKELERQMQESIKAEAYEKAANLRDEIAALRKSLKNVKTEAS